MKTQLRLLRRNCRRLLRRWKDGLIGDDPSEMPVAAPVAPVVPLPGKVLVLRDYPTQKAVRELYWWCRDQERSNFSCLLYSLIAKADSANLARLQKGFPEFVAAYRAWHSAPDIPEFFRSYGVVILDGE